VPGDAYYWAGGRKIHLEPAGDVVVDMDSEAAGQAASTARSLRAGGRALTGSMVMVSRAAAEEALGEAAASAPGVHPVYRAQDDTLIAVLPEVRVEGDARSLQEIERALGAAHVTERTDERLVLAPDSGRGEDALALANRIAERGGADVAQARFIRVVARPGP
jgi:ubiquinone biosynthesis protein UbiJ